MRKCLLIAILGLALLPVTSWAQTLTVLSSNAAKTAVNELGPQFEKATGQHLSLSFANSADLKARIEKGEAFDVAILTSPLIDDLIKQGKLAASSRANIARAGAGVAIRKGAPKPDISTPEALKRTLIAAKSVAYVGQGATASIVRGIFDRFGIAAEMNAKTRLVLFAAEAVAAGEAELGFTQIPEILPIAGAELAGPLPAELQVYTVFGTAIAAASKQSAAAAAFIRFLTSPTAASVINAKGMQSMTAGSDRLPPMPATAMTDAQKKSVEEFKAARGVDVSGPFHPLLRSPELMSRARAMGDYLRYKSALPPRLSEFVILLTAREWAQQYEWNAHYPIALKAGVSQQVAQAIAEGRRPAGMTEEEEILFDFCHELHRDKNVSDPTYSRALAKFGEQGVIDTVGINGYYTLLAMVLNTARTPAGDTGSPVLRPLPR
ncbi:MAG: substrate-binding domain-containing protein [Vicinamibacterales bacterium]